MQCMLRNIVTLKEQFDVGFFDTVLIGDANIRSITEVSGGVSPAARASSFLM